MAREGKGYRVRRLKARRRERLHRGQFGMLVAFAAAVALAAVFGAYRLARYLTADDRQIDPRGSLVLVTFGDDKRGPRPSAFLTLYDGPRDSWRLYTVPRRLLLEGKRGEYVMAGDAMGTEALPADLARLIQVSVAYDIRLPYAALVRLAGADRLILDVAAPLELRVRSSWRTYQGSFDVGVRALPELLGARGRSGEDEDGIARAGIVAVMHAGALQPAARRRAAVTAAVADIEDEQLRTAAARVLSELLRGRLSVDRLPSEGVVAEGQFAFRPNRERIMAEVTRRAPGYVAHYTVLVRNGTGEAGVGDVVRRRLAVLDVNLPASANAESFDYARTQILAGSRALAVAEDVRAILGRGVVLRGDGLPATTLMVIIGADLKAEDLQ